MKNNSDVSLLQLYLVCKFYVQRQEYFRNVGTLEANKRSNDAYEGLKVALYNVAEHLN